MLDNWKDVESIGMMAFWHRISSITSRQEMLWRSEVTINIYPLVTTRAEFPMSINWKDISQDLGRIASVYQLTSHDLRENELRFDLSHCRLTQSVCADINWYTWACGGLYLSWLNCQRPRLSFHLQVLVLPVPLPRLPPIRLLHKSISILIIFKTSYVWHILFRRTFKVRCMNLSIIRKVW